MARNDMEVSVPTYRLIAAGIAMLLYLIVAGVILARVLGGASAMDTVTWQQVIVVFNAVGAIATTAAGVLLGVEIQHASAQDSERRANLLSRELQASRAAAAAALHHLEGDDSAARSGTVVSAARTALLGMLAPHAAG
jgi:hypothetical protein